MKSLTYDEIVKAFENKEQLSWHPDYQHERWKDGEAPLTLVHVSFFREVEDIKTKNKHKEYFIGYRCSKENCSCCSSKSISFLVGPHHIIIKRNGHTVSPKVEWIEYSKRTEVKESPNPVFVKL